MRIDFSSLCSGVGCCRHYIAVEQDNTATFGVILYYLQNMHTHYVPEQLQSNTL